MTILLDKKQSASSNVQSPDVRADTQMWKDLTALSEI
jgi:hypothetical protein